MMNLDKEFYFPLYSRTSSTPSIFSVQLATSQYENYINSTSGLLNGFTTNSNQGQSPILSTNSMHLSHISSANYQSQMGFNYNLPTNFSPNYPCHQIPNNAPFFEHSLLLDHHSTPLGLNNSLLKVPCHDLINANSPGDHPSVLPPTSSLPRGNDNVLTGDDNNGKGDDGGNIKRKPKKSTTKKKTHKSGNGGSNTQAPAGSRRRKGYKRKAKNTFGERSSMYRGVSRYTGRFEAFVWDNTDPSVKGRTVYVGGFEKEEDAARAYDLAALKFWGPSAPLNFPINDYGKELAAMQFVSREEFLLKIRRKSKGFAKGVSNYRGVSRNSDGKKWQARLGKGRGTKGLYLGTFQTEVEAARAYDVAVLRMKGLHAITNFDLNHYDIPYILESSTLPIGKGASKTLRMTPVEDVLELTRKTRNKKFSALELEEPDTPTSDHDDQTDNIADHDDQDKKKNALTPISPSLDDQNPSLEISQDGDDFQFLSEEQFYLNQNPSFDDHRSLPEDGDHHQLETSPSFLNLLTAASGSSTRDSNGLELGDHLTMTEAAGDHRGGAASTDMISWSELQQMETQEFHDFHDFFSHDNKFNDDFQNPSLLNGSAHGGTEQ